MKKLLSTIFKTFFAIIFFVFIYGVFTTPPTPVVSPAQLSKWRSEMRLGLSKKQVREILGEPDHIDANFLNENWQYKCRTDGRVEFSSDSGKVTGWTEPIN